MMRAIAVLALLCSGQQVFAFPALADKFGSSFHSHSKRVGFNVAQEKVDSLVPTPGRHQVAATNAAHALASTRSPTTTISLTTV